FGGLSLMNDTPVTVNDAEHGGLPSVGASSCQPMPTSAFGSTVGSGTPPERSAKWTTVVPGRIGPSEGVMQVAAVQVFTPGRPPLLATALSSLGMASKLRRHVPRSPAMVNLMPV